MFVKPDKSPSSTPDCENPEPVPRTSKLNYLKGGGAWLTTEPLDFKVWAELDYDIIANEFNSVRRSVNATIFETPSDETFLKTITSIQSRQLDTHNIPSTWHNLAKLDANIETRPANTRILTVLSLESHSDMWTWFNEHVTKPTWCLATIPIPTLLDMQKRNIQPEVPNEWIYPLFQAVTMAVFVHNNFSLSSKDYFPDIDAPNYEASPGVGTAKSKIIHHVEAAVILWLQFRSRPGMTLETSRGIATFTSIAKEAFKSQNFLYLSYIQDAIKRLRSVLTEEKTALSKVPWEQLAEELKNHPLAFPDSNETLALNHLVELWWTISSLPCSHPSDISDCYKKAIAIGGDAGVEMFAKFMAQL